MGFVLESHLTTLTLLPLISTVIINKYYFPGFHVCPQLAHLFTVLLLPKNPVSNE